MQWKSWLSAKLGELGRASQSEPGINHLSLPIHTHIEGLFSSFEPEALGVRRPFLEEVGCQHSGKVVSFARENQIVAWNSTYTKRPV